MYDHTSTSSRFSPQRENGVANPTCASRKLSSSLHDLFFFLCFNFQHYGAGLYGATRGRMSNLWQRILSTSEALCFLIFFTMQRLLQHGAKSSSS
jgi:hypothetical protein